MGKSCRANCLLGRASQHQGPSQTRSNQADWRSNMCFQMPATLLVPTYHVTGKYNCKSQWSCRSCCTTWSRSGSYRLTNRCLTAFTVTLPKADLQVHASTVSPLFVDAPSRCHTLLIPLYLFDTPDLRLLKKTKKGILMFEAW